MMRSISDRRYPVEVVRAMLRDHFRLVAEDAELYSNARRCIFNAFDEAERYTDRVIIDSRVEFTFDNVTDSVIELSTAPVKRVSEIWYYAADGQRMTLPEDSYRLIADEHRAYVELAAVPQLSPTRRMARLGVVARCGYSDYVSAGELTCDGGIPLAGSIEQAVKLMAGTFFENMADVVLNTHSASLPITAQHLLNSYRLTPYGT